jgi:hypothetical protein
VGFPDPYKKHLFVPCAVGYLPVIVGGVVYCQPEVQDVAVPVSVVAAIPNGSVAFTLVAGVANKRIVVASVTLSGVNQGDEAACRLKSGITIISPWLQCPVDSTFQLRPPPFPVATAIGEALNADNPLGTDAQILLNYTLE